MTNIFDDPEEEAAPVPGDASLRSVAVLADKVLKARAAVAETEDLLKRRKEYLRLLEEFELPKALAHAGTDGFDLKGGGRVVLKVEYHASIPKKNRAAAHALLSELGHGDLVKKKLSILFPKGSNSPARLIDTLKAEFKDGKVTESDGIAAPTLKAFARAEIESGSISEGDDTCKLLGIFVRRYADVSLPGEATGGRRKKARTDDEPEPEADDEEEE